MKKIWCSVLLAALLAGAGVAVKAAARNTLTPVNAPQYETMDKSGTVVLVFSASYCRPCRQLKRLVLKDAAAQHAAVRFLLVDTENDVPATSGRTLMEEFDVKKLPTLFVLKDGVQKWQRVGFSKEEADAYKRQLSAELSK